MNMRDRVLKAFVLACLPLLGHAADPANAGDANDLISAEQIKQALHPPQTHHFKERGLMRRDTSEASASTGAADAQSAVNLNIAFEYNSSNLKPQASAQLEVLAKALSSDTLARDRFLIAGHTDAKGSAAYNQRLSQRRAEAVKRFLIASGLAPGRLDTVGYGSEHLVRPDQPLDPSNRRVEIRDLGAGADAPTP